MFSLIGVAHAQPGRDGPYTAPGAGTVVNEYAVLFANRAVGDTSVRVTDIDDLDASLMPAQFMNVDLAVGDLLLVYQPQGATVDTTTNGVGFGAVTALNNAGHHEFIRVGAIAGNRIDLDATFSPTGLRNAYSTAGHTQVIRVPQYTSLTVPAMTSISAQAWDGARGGVVVVAVQGTTSVVGAIDANAAGFRGGAVDNNTTTGITAYFSDDSTEAARKGESIVGSDTEYNTLNVRFARGAIANGGGGGDAHNGGGGGGGNGDNGNAWNGQGVMDSHAAWVLDPGYMLAGVRTTSAGGGRGGYTWGNANRDATMEGPGDTDWAGDSRREAGGLGGRPVTNALGTTLFFGGGGGAGDGNNSGAGAGGAGGGLVILLSRTVSGSGTIRANGANGVNQNSDPGDAPGGGGAGGTIVVSALTLGSVTVTATGGAGGNQLDQATDESEGPGGGGGGGYIATVGGAVTRTVTGGIGGTTNAPALTEFAQNGATGGQAGQTATAPTCAAFSSCPLDLTTAVDILVPSNGATVTDTTPTITGTTESGATVAIRIDGGAAAAATVTGTTWTFTPGVALSSGMHTILATATDAAGNMATDMHIITVDGGTVVDIVTPANGARVNDTTPTLTGTTEAGATVVIRIDGGAGVAAVVTGTNWTFTPGTALSLGAHTFLATATDGAGNTATDTHTITIDTSTSVDIVAPANGSTVADTTPTITGTTETGATVVIRIDGGAGAAAVVTGTSWTFTPGIALSGGSHTILATATDGAGNTATDTHTITVDSGTVVDIVAPANGARVNDTTPTITGTTEAGATVAIRIDGGAAAAATVTGTNWTFTPGAALSIGSHTILATATDGGGNTATDTHTITIDTSTTVDIVTPANGSSTSDTTPTLTGTTEAGSTVVIAIDGGATAPATVTGTTWTFTVGTALSAASHSFTATATDAAGNTATDTHTITIDTATTVDIVAPADGEAVADTTPTITGTTEAGATVVIRIDGGAGAAATVTGTTWTFTPGTALSAGSHTILATATDGAGNTATDTHTITIDAATVVDIVTPADGATLTDPTPTITGTTEAGATVLVRIDGGAGVMATVTGTTWTLDVSAALANGAHTLEATATDGLGHTATDTHDVTIDAVLVVTIDAPADGSTTGDPRPTIVGTSEPGATIVVSIDDVEVGTVTADPSGQFILALLDPLAPGEHEITAHATLDALTADATSTVEIVTDEPYVEILSPAEGSTTRSLRPIISGRTRPNATVTVAIDGATGVAVIADAAGLFMLTPSADLALGDHVVTAEDTLSGMTASDDQRFTIDAAAPTVDIVTPADGTRIADATPTIVGTSDALATIHVRIDGMDAGEATADASGNWTFDVPSELADGTHIVDAEVVAGGRSATDRHLFIIDTTTVVTITTPADGSTSGDRTPTIEGTGEPGATVALFVDGEEVADGVVGSDGRFTLSVPTNLDDGEHELEVRAEDDLGNTDADAITVTIGQGPVDTDGDGIDDETECGGPVEDCPDSDGDGDPDFMDPDDDNDGIPTEDERPDGEDRDTDGDGMPDHLDPDDDNDGIPTEDERPDGEDRDTDGDGMPDHLDPDDDNDGIPTMSERPGNEDRDSDEDGMPDHLDDDDDNDTILTREERPDGRDRDTDDDGMPDHLDTDDENDGILTEDEPNDDDDNGVPDYLEPPRNREGRGYSGGALCAVTFGPSQAPLVALIGLGVMLALRARRRKR